jgi:hypothetical protein
LDAVKQAYSSLQKAAPQRITMGGGNRQNKGSSQNSSNADEMKKYANAKAKRKADSGIDSVKDRPKSVIIFFRAVAR